MKLRLKRRHGATQGIETADKRDVAHVEEGEKRGSLPTLAVTYADGSDQQITIRGPCWLELVPEPGDDVTPRVEAVDPIDGVPSAIAQGIDARQGEVVEA